MSDESPADEAEALSAQEREVRRLLADARVTEPMPEAVSARLERVLADLAAPSAASAAASDPATPVTALASRRRRRAATMLVAAAAVVAVGVGLGQVLDRTDQGEHSVASADRRTAGREASGSDDSGKSLTAPGATPAPQRSDRGRGHYVRHRTTPIRPRHFASDVRSLRSLLDLDQGKRRPESDGAAAAPVCRSEHWGAGAFVPVTYGRHHGVLVFRHVSGDTQVVDLFQCGSPDALRSITLPAP
jgi:hypothetical protein